MPTESEPPPSAASRESTPSRDTPSYHPPASEASTVSIHSAAVTPERHPIATKTAGSASMPEGASPRKPSKIAGKGKKRSRSLSVASVEDTDLEEGTTKGPKKKRGKGKIPRPPMYEEGEGAAQAPAASRQSRFPWHLDHYQPHLRVMAQEYSPWKAARGAARTRHASTVAKDVFQTWGTHDDVPLQRFIDVRESSD